MKYLLAIIISSAIAFAGGYFVNDLRSAPEDFNKKNEYKKLINLVSYATISMEENNTFLNDKILSYANDSLIAKSGKINSAQGLVLLHNQIMDSLKYAKQLAVAKGGGYRINMEYGGYLSDELYYPYDINGANQLLSSNLATNIQSLIGYFYMQSDMLLGDVFNPSNESLFLPSTIQYNEKWGEVIGRKNWEEYYFKNTTLSSAIVTLHILEYNQVVTLNLVLNKMLVVIENLKQE